VIAMSQSFGQPQPMDFDKLIEHIVRDCHQRSPEALDRTFDALPRNDEPLSQSIITAIVAHLQSDLDTLSWFCGYMASEISRCEDSDRSHLPITALSRTLITLGFQPFQDFSPYPGQRIIILSPEKFEALPKCARAEVEAAFDLLEQSGEQVQQVNEAIRQELNVVLLKESDCE
jgi:hypothetical protein